MPARSRHLMNIPQLIAEPVNFHVNFYVLMANRIELQVKALKIMDVCNLVISNVESHWTSGLLGL